jgi:hypothetical protein
MKTPYEIYKSDSGTLRIITEGDRTVMAQGNALMSKFFKNTPTGMIFSGKATAELIEASEKIARECEGLQIYVAPTDQEVASLEAWLNGHSAKDLKDVPVSFYVNGEDGKSEKVHTTLSEVVGSTKKAEIVAKVIADFRAREAQKLKVQCRRMFGMLKQARIKAGLPAKTSRAN